MWNFDQNFIRFKWIEIRIGILYGEIMVRWIKTMLALPYLMLRVWFLL